MLAHVEGIQIRGRAVRPRRWAEIFILAFASIAPKRAESDLEAAVLPCDARHSESTPLWIAFLLLQEGHAPMTKKLTEKEEQMNRSVHVMARHFEYEIKKIAENTGFPRDLYRERIAAELALPSSIRPKEENHR